MPIIIAGVLALIAVVIAGSYFKQREARLAALAARSVKVKQTQEENKKVVVAKEDIIKGSAIDSKMIEIASVPQKFIQPGATSSTNRIIGKITTAPIAKGEQILRNKLASNAADFTSLSYRTPTGKRAITIPVDNISSVGGMIRTDDYVDILGLIPQTMQVGEERVTQYATVPLFQKVLVLAVGRSAGSKRVKGGESGTVSTITVALEPQKATMVAFIQEQGGKLRFILRSPSDTQVTPAQMANWDTLFLYLFPDLMQKMQSGNAEGVASPMMLMKQGKAAVEKTKEPTGPQVEIYRGSQREVVPLLK